MMCTILGCPGRYEEKQIARTYRRRGELIVIDGIPAEVCSVCGDTLLRLETVDRIQATIGRFEEGARPPASAPLFRYGVVA